MPYVLTRQCNRLFGITTVQSFIYYLRNRADHLALRLTVCISLLHTPRTEFWRIFTDIWVMVQHTIIAQIEMHGLIIPISNLTQDTRWWTNGLHGTFLVLLHGDQFRESAGARDCALVRLSWTSYRHCYSAEDCSGPMAYVLFIPWRFVLSHWKYQFYVVGNPTHICMFLLLKQGTYAHPFSDNRHRATSS